MDKSWFHTSVSYDGMLGKAYANASIWPILYRKRPTAMLMVALELPECTSGRWGEVFVGVISLKGTDGGQRATENH